MGKKIDYFVLTAGITVLFYFYFRGALGNPAIAMILALICCLIINRIRRLLSRLFRSSSCAKRREYRKHAAGALMYLACMDAEDALEKLRSLIEKIYGGQYAMAVLQQHPASVLQPEELFRVWKAHRGEEKLVVCATCHSEAACRAMAADLKQPKLALIDAGALSQLLAEHPEGMFPPEEKQQRRRLKLRRLQDLLICRRNAPRCLMMFASMLLIYVFSANFFYLAAAMLLLMIALLSLRRQARPAKLF